jgi:hypothetical protein
MAKVTIGKRLLISNTKSFEKELNKINKFRTDMGLKPIVTKKRLCNKCDREFQSMVGYFSDFNCGCLKYKGKEE